MSGPSERASGGASIEPLPDQLNLCNWFLDHNLRAGRGQKVALRCGDESRTYAQVSERAAQVAAVLRRMGVRPEERVLIVLPDGVEVA